MAASYIVILSTAKKLTWLRIQASMPSSKSLHYIIIMNPATISIVAFSVRAPKNTTSSESVSLNYS